MSYCELQLVMTLWESHYPLILFLCPHLFPLFRQRCGKDTHIHAHIHAQTSAAFLRPLVAVSIVLFWPAPIRPVESINLYSLGRKAISGRSYWASCLMLKLRNSHWEVDWRAQRAHQANQQISFYIRLPHYFKHSCKIIISLVWISDIATIYCIYDKK